MVQTIEATPKKRLYYIDNLRVLACFLVLLTHSTMAADNPSKDGIWMFALSFMGSPSSELFLALSGTVLLPVVSGTRKFYSRRFKKLLPPLIIWSILGVTLRAWINHTPASDTLDTLLHIPFGPVISVYWFVYEMSGLYLFAPFISPWIHNASNNQIELFLCLWIVNMIYPWIAFFVPGFKNFLVINGNNIWPLSYFYGFLGYWIMGLYLKRYPVKIGINWRCVCIVIGTIVYPLAIFFTKLSGQDTTPLMDNLQIGSAFLVAFLYTLMQNIKLKDRVQRVVSQIAKYSFGIYLTHLYIARDLYWGVFKGSTIHIFPRTFIIAILTLITGYALTWALSRIPKGKYITGA